MQLAVGRIARAHGIAGEVAVEIRTDAAEQRFAVGASLDTDPPERGPLVVTRVRHHSGRLLVTFDGVADRTAAEALRGVLLVADSASSPPNDAEEFWDHDLDGLEVLSVDDEVIGVIAEVLHPPGSDLLVVRRPDGTEVLVPFVREIVPVVDLPVGRVVVNPPEGLLDL